jgi:site-specific recombinase XerD
MSNATAQREALLTKFAEHVAHERYAPGTIRAYVAVADDFLEFLSVRQVSIADVQTGHLTKFLDRELRRFSRRRGHPPASVADWRSHYASAIRRLLWCANGHLPVIAAPRCAFEAFSQALHGEYTQWLDAQRGLATETIDGLVGEEKRFLAWYGEGRSTCTGIAALAITDIDAYLQARAASLRRVSRKAGAQQLRCFLRFAHATGRTERDLAPSVTSPTLYALESIPSCLRPDEIRAVVEATRKDHSPKGRRDYAILLLLATYGMRAGEITRLKLEDIDWRADRFCVRHTKTARQSLLPLVPTVGNALLAYLRCGRPSTDAREIFIRMCAPYRGLVSGSSLYSTIRERLDAAGVTPLGKRGPHAFRHARAASLLRAGVSQKIIGDVLGHRSAASTAPYLKLATAELRQVALEIPMDVAGEPS